MAVIQELITKLSFQTDEAPLRRVEGAINRIRVGLELLAGYEMVKKFTQVAERFAAWGQDLQVTAENIGMNVEALEKLEYAAEKSGVSGEELAHSMALLSRHLYEARTQGGEALLVFSKMGITGDQVLGFKSAEQAFYAVSDALQKMPDPIARLGAAQEVLGRGGYKLVSMASKGSASIHAMGEELQRLGLVLSGREVAGLTALNHSFQKLFAILKAIGSKIVAEVGPAFSYLIDKFAEFYQANKDLIQMDVRLFLHRMEYAIGVIIGLFMIVKRGYKELKDFFGAGDITAGFLLELAAAYVAIRMGIGLFKTFTSTVKLLAKAFEFLTSVEKIFAAVNGGLGFLMALGEALLLLAAISAIVLVLHDLYAMAKGQKTWIESIIDSIAEWHKLRYAIEFVKTTLGGVWDVFKGIMKSMAEGISDAFSRGFDIASKRFDVFYQKIKSFIDTIKALWAFFDNSDIAKKLEAGQPKEADDGKPHNLISGIKAWWNKSTATAEQNTKDYYDNRNATKQIEGAPGFVGPPRSAMTPEYIQQAKSFLGMDGNPSVDDRLSSIGSVEKAIQSVAQTFNVQGDQQITYNNDITINPPSGVSAKDIAHHTVNEIKKSHEYEKNKAALSVSSPLGY